MFVAVTNALKTKSFQTCKGGRSGLDNTLSTLSLEGWGYSQTVVMTNGGQHKAGVAVNNTHYYNEYGIT